MRNLMRLHPSYHCWASTMGSLASLPLVDLNDRPSYVMATEGFTSIGVCWLFSFTTYCSRHICDAELFGGATGRHISRSLHGVFLGTALKP
jgi:hypothetical protein